MSKWIRLDKYLSDMNRGTRSQLRQAVQKGRVEVNGVPEMRPERKVCPQEDEIVMDGERISYHSVEYYMLNKPAGVVSATEDRRYPTVVSLLGEGKRKDLFPVGRLDIDTEGLLLLTNDGLLAHQLLSPAKHVDKQYYARVLGKLPEDAVLKFAGGITLEDGTQTLPAELHIHDQTDQHAEVYLTVQEGKFHQVKRMFEAVGCHVEYLKRISMGPLVLDPALQSGRYRALSDPEIARLKKSPDYKDGLSGEIMCKKAVIFDLDGTLVDSMWMWHDIDVEYLAGYGWNCPPMLQREIEGMSFTETAIYFKERFAIPDSLDEIKAAWVQMSLDKYRHEVPLKKGAGRFLNYLKGKGIRLGIATSNGSDMVQAVLKAQGVVEDFDCVVTACEVAHGKPAPDIYLKVASELGVEPQDCLVFEDIPAGIVAGKAAGMTVCAVEDEHSAWLRAEKIALADYYVRDYEELL